MFAHTLNRALSRVSELRRARRTHDTQIGRHLDDKDHSGVRYLKMKERMKVDREKRASIVASRSQMLSAADLDKIKMELDKSSRSDQQNGVQLSSEGEEEVGQEKQSLQRQRQNSDPKIQAQLQAMQETFSEQMNEMMSVVQESRQEMKKMMELVHTMQVWTWLASHGI